MLAVPLNVESDDPEEQDVAVPVSVVTLDCEVVPVGLLQLLTVMVPVLVDEDDADPVPLADAVGVKVVTLVGEVVPLELLLPLADVVLVELAVGLLLHVELTEAQAVAEEEKDPVALPESVGVRVERLV